MAISFGIAKKIIDHPSYNLGLALPFVCAFYVLNTSDSYIIPIIDLELGSGLSTVLNVLGVAFYYIISLFMFLLAGGISKMVGESKGWLYFLLAFFVFTSLYSFLSDENVPRVGLLFGVLSFLYLLLVFLKMEDGSLSVLLMILTGGVLSLLLFVLGILWFDGHYLFTETIAKVLGLSEIAAESYRIGSVALVTSGYVIFYAVFQTGELWSE